MSGRKMVGLALGSGAMRGWSHIGVIEALEENKIPIDYIAGSSAGAIVGSIYAGGGLKSLKNYVLGMEGKKLFSFYDFVLSKYSVLDADKKLNELFFAHTSAKKFSDLKIPVKLVATDLYEGTKVVIDTGSIIEGLRASISFPGLIEPARIRNRWVIDGGIVDPVPISVARAMGADIIIAVDLNTGMTQKNRPAAKNRKRPDSENKKPAFKSEMINKLASHYESAEKILKEKFSLLFSQEAPPNILATLMTSIDIMQERITRINLAVDPADILIQPGVGQLKMMDFNQVKQTIDEGYNCTMKQMDKIKSFMQGEA